MICYIKDCIDPATTYIMHCHHDDPDKKCKVDREDENHCAYTICQRHMVQLKDKQQQIRLRHNTQRVTFVAMHQCQYHNGRFRFIIQ
jgi:hypothetical protein